MARSEISSTTVCIHGAGVIGLSCAWVLADRGAQVALFDISEPGRGASWAAAGMLAPAYEAAGAAGVHPRLFELCDESAQIWPDFAKALEAASGRRSGYSDHPAIAVARTSDDLRNLDRIEAALAGHANAPRRLTTERARTIEPALGDAIVGALELPSDTQVDNRAVVEALIAACRQSGVAFVGEPDPSAAFEIHCKGWRTPGVEAFGGQMVSLRADASHPKRVVRCGDIYIAPKDDRTIVGATMEPGVARLEPDAASVADLRDQAADVCPSLAIGDEMERWANVRPGTSDHAPLIGWTTPRMFVAAGHFRNGVLLAPITARIVADAVLEGRIDESAEAFSPNRFEGASS